MKHRTKDGREIELADLGLGNLKNILSFISKKAKEGVLVRCGGGTTAEDIWYDEDTIYGKEALAELNYDKYQLELSRREKHVSV